MALNLSFAALLVGGLAAGLFWISFVGFGLGFLGLLIGAIGFAAASSRQKLAVQLFCVGGALSLLGIGLGAYWSFARNPASSEVAMSDAAAKAAATTIPESARAEASKTGKKLAGSSPAAQKTADSAKRDVPGKAKTLPRSGTKPSGDAQTLARATGGAPPGAAPPGATSGAAKSAVVASADDKDPKAGATQDGQPAAEPKAPSHNTVAKLGSIQIFAQEPTDKPADGSDSTPAASDAAMTPDRAAASIVWADGAKGETQNNDDLEVSIAKVTLGPAVLSQAGATNELLAQTRETSQPYLTIWIKIKNAQLAGSTEYHGWISQPVDGPDAPKLVDDQVHTLGQMPMEKGMMILNGHPSGTIKAGDSLQDALIYRPPGVGVQYLRLTLPGKVLGTTGTYHFQIPMSMATSGLSTNPLLPSQ